MSFLDGMELTPATVPNTFRSATLSGGGDCGEAIGLSGMELGGGAGVGMAGGTIRRFAE
jgi:hypothetical protein